MLPDLPVHHRLIILVGFLFPFWVAAQNPQAGKGAFKSMNVGHFYGKVVDAKTNKAVEYATVQLFQFGYDSVSKKSKDRIISGALTEANGEFSLENLPVMGEFTLRITAIGYDSLTQKVSFNIDLKSIQQGNYQKALNGVDKDLGNLKLNPMAITLSEVTVSGEEPVYRMELDKKIYNPGKDPSNSGLMADEVMKKIPAVQVDIDGNVTLRNAAPQILVDGRPTTLTLDQIPSDVIDKIEVITNPSAKFDASGGQSGIINIVMKKNRRIGYNGNLRAGIDKRAKINLGGDVNLRQGKVNVFATANYHQRKPISYSSTERYNLFGDPLINIFQTDTPVTNGQTGFGSLGVDYFMNNRNTISLSGTYVRGQFNSDDVLYLTYDSLFSTGTSSSYSERTADNSHNFQNLGSMLSFKHLFPKEGYEWTADANYNQSRSDNEGLYFTKYFDGNYTQLGGISQQKQEGSGKNRFLTLQTDYENPLSKVTKIEAGARAAIRHFESVNHIYQLDDSTNDYYEIPDLNNYKYDDQVYAAYTTFSNEINKFKYQVGLRVESSFYTGTLTDADTSFRNNFPLSLFPSGFVQYSLTDNSDLQLNYTRRIDRPSFFQLMPFTDYSDSLNLQRGNPNLKPQFTNTIEFSYEKNFDRSNNLVASAYFKNTTNLITRYQTVFYDSSLSKDILVNTYVNAHSSYLYGLEFTGSNSVKKWLTLTSSLNLFESYINGENIEGGLTNSQFSWFAKVSATFKLPMNFTLQLNADYQSRTSVPQGGMSGFGGGGGRGMGGGGGYFGTPPATVQGYVDPVYGVDFSARKDFLKNKTASVTLSFSDIFRTRTYTTHYDTDYFTQTSERIRDPFFIRLNFAYRFGKFDTSLFKRKNFNNNGDMMQDMGGQ
jgi:outer membrane receptor protein involved in Fe transport